LKLKCAVTGANKAKKSSSPTLGKVLRLVATTIVSITRIGSTLLPRITHITTVSLRMPSAAATQLSHAPPLWKILSSDRRCVVAEMATPT
jgi:hypothetical protein